MLLLNIPQETIMSSKIYQCKSRVAKRLV